MAWLCILLVKLLAELGAVFHGLPSFICDAPVDGLDGLTAEAAVGAGVSSQGTACLGMSSAMGVPGCVNFVDDLAQGQYLSTP